MKPVSGRLMISPHQFEFENIIIKEQYKYD